MQLLVKGGMVLDGTGAAPYRGDILISDGRIAAIGSFPSSSAERVLDAQGAFVFPGIIDAHGGDALHAGILDDPTQGDFLLQGVTTVIGGHGGRSLAPLSLHARAAEESLGARRRINADWRSVKEFFSTLSRTSRGVHFGTLIGGETILKVLSRRGVSRSGESELVAECAAALASGALGLSSRSATPSSTAPLLDALAHAGGGVLATECGVARSLRSRISQTLAAAERTAGARLVLSGLRRAMRALSDRQRASLLSLFTASATPFAYFDLSPHDASLLSIRELLPEKIAGLSESALLAALRREPIVRSIREEISSDGRSVGEFSVLSSHHAPFFEGRTIGEIARDREVSSGEAFVDLLALSRGEAELLVPDISSDELTALLAHPSALVGSFGASLTAAHASFRAFTRSSFPLFFRRLRALLPLETAVSKVTLLPARVYGIPDRGCIAPRMVADLAVFRDGEAIHTVVSGAVAVENGELTAARGGRPILRHV